jgi:hypothetical protein
MIHSKHSDYFEQSDIMDSTKKVTKEFLKLMDDLPTPKNESLEQEILLETSQKAQLPALEPHVVDTFFGKRVKKDKKCCSC